MLNPMIQRPETLAKRNHVCFQTLLSNAFIVYRKVPTLAFCTEHDIQLIACTKQKAQLSLG